MKRQYEQAPISIGCSVMVTVEPVRYSCIRFYVVLLLEVRILFGRLVRARVERSIV